MTGRLDRLVPGDHETFPLDGAIIHSVSGIVTVGQITVRDCVCGVTASVWLTPLMIL